MRRQFVSWIWQHFDSLYFVSVSAFICLHRCAIVSHSPFWPLLSLPLSCVSKSLPLLDSLSCISVPVCLPVVPYSHQTFPLSALSILYLLMAALMLPAPQSDNKNLWFHLSPALWLYVLFLFFQPFQSWLTCTALRFAAAWTHTYLCNRTWFDAAFLFCWLNNTQIFNVLLINVHECKLQLSFNCLMDAHRPREMCSV